MGLRHVAGFERRSIPPPAPAPITPKVIVN